MSNVIIDLKILISPLRRNAALFKRLRMCLSMIEKGDIYGIVGYSGLGNLPLCAQSIFCKCLPLVKSLSVKM